jgi:hypothetical protein
MIRFIHLHKPCFLFLLTPALLWATAGQAQVTNQNPPARPLTRAVGTSVLLDDIVLGGFLRACVGANGALGSPPCPTITYSPVGLRLDPDGAAGPLAESEDVNQGYFEERWCVEHNLLGSVCNSGYDTFVGGFDQTNTSTPGRLQSTGHALTPDLRLRIDQVVTLRSQNRCLELDVTLTNVGSTVLTNVEYLRDHDPDLGTPLGLGATTDNQTIHRPLPGGAPPMIVAATVRNPSPLETRTIGLGTSALPPPGVIADVGILTGSLFETDPDPTLDGGPGITRGPLVNDVGNTLAFRIASLAPGESEDLSLCYCLASTTANIGAGTVAADLTQVFDRDCGVLEALIDIKPGGFPNSINPRSNGVIPVAILTTPEFDATQVDPLTGRFGPGGASEAHGKGHLEDVDGDGDIDLVLHFRTQDAAIPCAATQAALTGETYAGRRIEGSDSVKTSGCR